MGILLKALFLKADVLDEIPPRPKLFHHQQKQWDQQYLGKFHPADIYRRNGSAEAVDFQKPHRSSVQNLLRLAH